MVHKCARVVVWVMHIHVELIFFLIFCYLSIIFLTICVFALRMDECIY